MLIRAEQPADRPAVLDVVRRAFGRPDAGEPAEVGLVHALFEDPGYLPPLSLLAERDGLAESDGLAERDGLAEKDREVIGHVMCTRGWIGEMAALGLGPLAVDPASQGAGVGSALMREVIARAQTAGERLICLLGSPAYYGRFGFTAAGDLGIEAPDPRWGAHFMALELAGRPVTAGRFRYAAPFDNL